MRPRLTPTQRKTLTWFADGAIKSSLYLRESDLKSLERRRLLFFVEMSWTEGAMYQITDLGRMALQLV